MYLSRALVYLIFFSGFSMSLLANESPSAAFQQAFEWQQKGKLDKAIPAYEDIILDGFSSPELFLNLGNAYAVAGNMGRAVLNFEKGLVLNANHRGLLTSLETAKGEIDSEIFEVQAFWPIRVWRQLCTSLSPNTWGILHIFSLLAIVLVWAGNSFRKWSWPEPKYKKIFYGLIGLSLLLGLILWSSIGYTQTETYAIVQKNVQLMSGPDERSEAGANIAPGEKVKVLDTFDEWKKVELLNQEEGFILSSSLGII